MIILGGVNIYPQEAESLLVTHPLVMDASVFGIPTTRWASRSGVSCSRSNPVLPVRNSVMNC